MQEGNKVTIGITGAAGNIGTTLINGLQGKYGIVSYDVKEVGGMPSGSFVRVDLSDREQLKGKFDGLDALVHLAGDPRPNAPREVTMRNNIVGTSYVFEEARHAGVKKIVFASSNFYHQGSVMEALKGVSGKLISLDTPPSPLCLYGESKVFGENVGRHLSNLGMQFIALRIGWTVVEDDPKYYAGPYMGAMFVSKRDLCQAFEKAIASEAAFLPAFVVSKNKNRVFDLSKTKEELGFEPLDRYEDYF